jgi:hypothetical protein
VSASRRRSSRAAGARRAFAFARTLFQVSACVRVVAGKWRQVRAAWCKRKAMYVMSPHVHTTGCNRKKRSVWLLLDGLACPHRIRVNTLCCCIEPDRLFLPFVVPQELATKERQHKKELRQAERNVMNAAAPMAIGSRILTAVSFVLPRIQLQLCLLCASTISLRTAIVFVGRDMSSRSLRATSLLATKHLQKERRRNYRRRRRLSKQS